MKTFLEILEAKVTRNLTDTYPAGQGEQHFVDKHIKMDILKKFRQKGNDNMFNGKVVKVFDRAKHRFGRDMNQSIVQYDESENLVEKKDNKPKPGSRHVYVDAKWVGTASWSKSNKEALKTWTKEHPDSHPTKIKIAHESEQVNEISAKLLDRYISKSDKDARSLVGIRSLSRSIENKSNDSAIKSAAKMSGDDADFKVKNRVKGLNTASNKLLDKKLNGVTESHEEEKEIETVEKKIANLEKENARLNLLIKGKK